MTNDTCILTTKDFTILEVMFDRCSDRSSPIGALLKRKLETAAVVFRDDVLPAIATLSSRVAYHCGDRQSDTRILCHDRMSSPGLFLPITTPLGLALLGLAEGQDMQFDTAEGPRSVLLETVAYQPEAARRERETIARLATPAMRRKAFRLVSGPLGDT
jgi:regulator of nucleoside diphosphate kinase